jgi:hypothetical protein
MTAPDEGLMELARGLVLLLTHEDSDVMEWDDEKIAGLFATELAASDLARKAALVEKYRLGNLGTTIDKLTRERDALRDGMERLLDWTKAYPLEAFPEPDMKRAAQVLKDAGMTLDAVSASNFRHVLKRVAEIATEALSTLDAGGEHDQG